MIWPVRLSGGPKDGEVIDTKNLFCNLYFMAPSSPVSMIPKPLPMELDEIEPLIKHVYRRTGTYTAQYVGYD